MKISSQSDWGDFNRESARETWNYNNRENSMSYLAHINFLSIHAEPDEQVLISRNLQDLIANNRHLTFIRFQNAGSQVMSTICYALQEATARPPNQATQQVALELQDCGRDYPQQALFAALTGNRIRQLVLKNCQISAILGVALKVNTSLSILTLQNRRDVEPTSWSSVAEGIASHRNLREVTISNMTFDVDELKALMNGLKQNETVQILDLSSNHLQDGAIHVAALLKNNSTITKLFLKINDITKRGGEALMEALKVNKTLTYLDISGNINMHDVRAVVDTLRVNTTLTHFYMAGVHLPFETAALMLGHLETSNSTLLEFKVSLFPQHQRRKKQVLARNRAIAACKKYINYCSEKSLEARSKLLISALKRKIDGRIYPEVLFLLIRHQTDVLIHKTQDDKGGPPLNNIHPELEAPSVTECGTLVTPADIEVIQSRKRFVCSYFSTDAKAKALRLNRRAPHHWVSAPQRRCVYCDRKPSTKCQLCNVHLCTRGKRGKASCFDLFHTVPILPTKREVTVKKSNKKNSNKRKIDDVEKEELKEVSPDTDENLGDDNDAASEVDGFYDGDVATV